MTPSQTTASLALAQVNLLLAETQQQAMQSSRYMAALNAIEKRTTEAAQELARLIAEAGAEAIAISTRITTLEAEVQHFITLNKAVGNT